jgi:hypothetical protein
LAENAAAYIKLSFVPDMSTDEVKEFLRKFRLKHQDRTIHACINGLVHEKIGAYILNSLDLTKKKMSDINQEEENRIASALTESNFQVLGTGDYSEAQVTRGGADTRYVSASNMESRLHPGLFITGELLDVDGICGGYNIMWAILTGMKAGNGIND